MEQQSILMTPVRGGDVRRVEQGESSRSQAQSHRNSDRPAFTVDASNSPIQILPTGQSEQQISY